MVELVNGGNHRHQRQPRTTRDQSEKLAGTKTSLTYFPGQEHESKRSEYRAQHNRDVHDSVALRCFPLAQVIAKNRIKRSKQWKLRNANPNPGPARDDSKNADKLAYNRKIISQHVHNASPLVSESPNQSSL